MEKPCKVDDNTDNRKKQKKGKRDRGARSSKKRSLTIHSDSDPPPAASAERNDSKKAAKTKHATGKHHGDGIGLSRGVHHMNDENEKPSIQKGTYFNLLSV